MAGKWFAAIFWAVLLGNRLQAGAAGIEFEAGVDRTRVALGEPIQLTLTISSSNNLPNLPAPQISLGDFEVDGPTVSTRVEIVDNSATFSRDLTYVLYPRRTGRFTVGPARLEVQGQTYQTKSFQVEVGPGRSRQSAAGQDAGQGSSGLEDQLFLRVQAQPKRVYVGQQVALNYDLCYRVQLHNVGFKAVPSFAGFWVKDLFVAQQLQAHREVIGGDQFNVSPLRQAALFPTSAGAHRIDPLVVSCTLPVSGRRAGGLLDAFGLFDDPLFGRSQTVPVRSQEVEIEAVPLPAQGRPAEFTGAVGRFSVQSGARPLQVPAGDPVTFRIEISGQGNLEAVKSPSLDHLPGFKVYPPKVETQEKVEDGRYGGTRSFEYILIPERGGQLEIPSIRFAYFDPQAGAYQMLQSDQVYIASQGGAPDQGSGYSLAPQEVQEMGQDIRHIAPDAEELGQGGLLYRSWLFWSFQFFLPVAFGGLVLYRRHQHRLQGDVAYARRRRAKGEAERRLRQARQLLAQGRGSEFHAEVERAVRAFLADHLNLPAAGLTGEAGASHLASRGVDEGLIGDLRQLQERCEFARFAPAAPAPEEMAQVQAQAERLIAALEKVI